MRFAKGSSSNGKQRVCSNAEEGSGDNGDKQQSVPRCHYSLHFWHMKKPSTVEFFVDEMSRNSGECHSH